MVRMIQSKKELLDKIMKMYKEDPLMASVVDVKCHFMVFVTVKDANPNGDPGDNGLPRTNASMHGLILNVCLRRHIRDWFYRHGFAILGVTEDELREMDGEPKSISEVAKPSLSKISSEKEFVTKACSTFNDVRMFGYPFTFLTKKNGFAIDNGALKVTGPITMTNAKSVSQVNISSYGLTRSANTTTSDKKTSDRMGEQNTVDFGLYVFTGAINAYEAKRTGLTNGDVELFKQAVLNMFENCESESGRGSGNITVEEMIFWKHDCADGQYCNADVFDTVTVKLKDGVSDPSSFSDYEITINELPGLTPEVLTSRYSAANVAV